MKKLFIVTAMLSLVSFVIACGDGNNSVATEEGREDFEQDALERLQSIDARLRVAEEDGVELQGGNAQRVAQSNIDGVRAERDKVADAIDGLVVLTDTKEWKSAKAAINDALDQIENRLNNLPTAAGS